MLCGSLVAAGVGCPLSPRGACRRFSSNGRFPSELQLLFGYVSWTSAKSFKLSNARAS